MTISSSTVRYAFLLFPYLVGLVVGSVYPHFRAVAVLAEIVSEIRRVLLSLSSDRDAGVLRLLHDLNQHAKLPPPTLTETAASF